MSAVAFHRNVYYSFEISEKKNIDEQATVDQFYVAKRIYSIFCHRVHVWILIHVCCFLLCCDYDLYLFPSLRFIDDIAFVDLTPRIYSKQKCSLSPHK